MSTIEVKSDIRPSFVEFLMNIINAQKTELKKIEKLQIRIVTRSTTIKVNN